LSKESGDKFRLLESQNFDSDLKRLIELDKNFIQFHLKTELVQYYFFEKVFNAFDIKGVVSIVFTTAFELCKERGIPTFVLQHGIGGKGHGHPYVSDYWFTLDDVSKESLDEWLDHTVNVLALGSPRYEFFKNAISSQRNVAKFNAKIGSTEHKVNVTYISSTNYPSHFESANIRAMKAMGELFDALVGYSDHTPRTIVPLGAVSLGACLIEKHFTDDKMRKGPDHPFAMDAKDFKEMVDSIRILEKALGSPVKDLYEEEKETVILQRRGLRAAKDIPKGSEITEDMIDVLRPLAKDALEPKYKEIVIGREAKEDMKKGDGFYTS